MKKVLSVVAAVAIAAVATSAGATSIKNSKHDLSVNGPDASLRGAGTQICVYCHTPHNARTEAPIWNRNDGKAGSSYKLYSGLGMANKSYKTGFTTDSVSLFCMSCHDGSSLGGLVRNIPTSEKDSAGTSLLSATGIKTTASTNLYKNSGDMRTTHPVNFVVGKTASATQKDIQTVQTGSLGTVSTFGTLAGSGFPLFKSSRPETDAATNTLECSSCHSVHDNTNSPFLRDTMLNSTLCLGCHNK
jgi:predicted CXXCH cytochrome family protein